MGNYFSSNKIAVENESESLQTNIVNEVKEEVAQSAPTPNNTEVETKRSLSAIPEEVVEEINQYFKEDNFLDKCVQKDASDNLVSNQTVTNLNEVTGVECEATEVKNEITEAASETIADVIIDNEKDEIVVAEESETLDAQNEDVSSKLTQLQLPTKKQKKKKQKTH
jgi:hypothetical protein